MVFGHNLQHMAPFGILTTGFCMVFRYAILIFSTTETIFGTPDPNLDPTGFRLGQGPFLAKNGARKKMVFHKKSFPKGFHGDPCRGNGLYGTQEAFGQASFPPNPTRKPNIRHTGPPPGPGPVGPWVALRGRRHGRRPIV